MARAEIGGPDMRLTDLFGKVRPEDLEPSGLPELKQVLTQFTGVPMEHVSITCGGSMALTVVLKTLRIRSEANLVLCPRPHFPGYPSLAALEGFSTGYFDLDPHMDWRPDIAALERQISEVRPAAVILNSPHNPTGSVLPNAYLKHILRAAESAGTMVVLDEVFAGIVYDGKEPESPSQHPCLIRVGSFNKRFPMMADSRLGYFLAEPGFLRDASLIHRTLAIGAGIEVQRRATELLHNEPSHIIRKVCAELQEQRDEAINMLRSSGLFDLHTPEGGLFLWLRLPDDWEPFAFRDAVWESLGFWCAAGPRFGCETESRVRLRFALPQELLRKQCTALARFAAQWRTR